MQADNGQCIYWLRKCKMYFSALDEILAVSLDDKYMDSKRNKIKIKNR